MEKTLYLRLLGEFSAEIEATPTLSFAARRAEAMLAYLAVTGRSHAREKLATLLWDDRSQKQALANLRSLLAQLPKPIKLYLTISRQSIAITKEMPIWLDTAAFISEMDKAKQDESQVIGKMEAALTYYRGDFLEGLFIRESRGLEEWIVITAERFHRLAAIAQHKLATHYLHHRRYQEGIHHARALLQNDPLQESNHRLLMLLLARSGQRNAALRQYQNCAALLLDELGIEPATETIALYDRIRQARTTPPFVVPTTFTPFIGRHAALATLNQRLDDPNCRLITLTGPGGVGKTRLSLQAAAEHKSEYLHGIYFIPLAGVESAAQLPLSIAAVLDFTFQDKIDPQKQLMNHLRQREILLILDNFEQIVEEGAEFVQALLSEAPLVKLLISSRERVNLQAEYLQTLSGLSHPTESHESLESADFEALQLFQECAARHQPGLKFTGDNAAAAVRICQMLEGLPLGIELVAASLAVYPIHQVEVELTTNLDFVSTHMRDLPQRHRSLRAVFQHSWQSLSERERAVYRRLTLFQGGFDSKAAQIVAQAQLTDLAALSSKSLIRLTDTDQYELHQILCQYATEKLMKVPGEIEDGRNRHTHYYMTMLAQSPSNLSGGDVLDTVDTLNNNIKNIRHAWQWTIDHQLIEILERGMKGLHQFYVLRGPFQEGYLLFNSAVKSLNITLLSVNGDQPKNWKSVLAQLLTYLARFSYELANYSESADIAQTAITLAQETSQISIEAEAQQLLGRALWRMGSYETTKIHFQNSLQLARQASVKQFEADALRGLGVLEAHQGDAQNAIKQYEAALTIYRTIKERSGEATTLNNLGNLFDDIGDYNAAQHHLEQALALHRELGDRKGAGNALNNLGVVFRHQSNHSQAAGCYAQALETFRDLGDRWREGLALINLSNIAIDQGNFTRAANLLPQALTLFQEINDPSGEGNSLALSGKVQLQLGRYHQAQTYFQNALAKFEEASHTYSQGLCLAYLSLTASYKGAYDLALDYGRKAIKTAETINNRPILGTAYANLGLAHLLSGNHSEAQNTYTRSIEIRQAIGETLLAIEATAGLTLSLLASNKLEDAFYQAKQMMIFLEAEKTISKDSHPLDGTDNPYFIYLACYKALKANDDERATAVLQESHALLHERADRILDETLRRPFLRNVPFNNEILTTYNKDLNQK